MNQCDPSRIQTALAIYDVWTTAHAFGNEEEQKRIRLRWKAIGIVAHDRLINNEYNRLGVAIGENKTHK